MKKLVFFFIFIIATIPLISCEKEELYETFPDKDLTDKETAIPAPEEIFIDFPEYDSPSLSFTSIEEIEDTINDTKWKYYIIFPNSYYENKNKEYPVLYLLHGLGSTYTSWVGGGDSKKCYDYCLYNDLLPEIIIIMPDAGSSYYVDGYENTNLQYENFFINQFIPEVESKYRIDKRYSCRMIAGCSMGGYGAAHYAFKYNDLFSYCYAMSGTLLGKGDGTTPSILEEIEGKNSNSLPLMTMDIGSGDGFLEMNEFVNRQLDLAGVPHEFIVRTGQHSWSFWKESIYLLYIRIGKILNGNIDFIN